MSGSHSSRIRHIAGFVLGSLIASVTSALVFLAFFPLPKNPDPRNHTGEAFIILLLVVFVCGGFIGRRALTWAVWFDLLSPVLGSYFFIVFLCLSAGLDLQEAAAMIGLASVGLAASISVLSLLKRCLPVKESCDV